VKLVEQIPRSAILWLIISQLCIVLPLVAELPGWTPLLVLLVAVVRLQILRGHWPWPGRGLRVLMMLAGVGGVVASYRSLLGLEPMVTLLVTAYALKLFETQSLRDGYLLAILGFFTAMTLFLYDQSIAQVLAVVVILTTLLSALLALNEPRDTPLSSAPLRRSAVLLTLALPMMLVVFLVFPRIAPLWSVPIKNHSAKTGMSDSIFPGDVTELGRDDSVAFRVQFEGDVPAQAQLYWRGLTLGRESDGRWLQHASGSREGLWRLSEAPERVKEPLRYRVIQAPTQQRWVYGLRFAETEDAGLLAINDFTLRARMPIEFERGYTLRSWSESVLEPELPEWRRTLETTTDVSDHPRTQRLVDTLRAQVDNRLGATDPAARDEAFVAEVLAWLRREPFYYTLSPPQLDAETFVDDFLFTSRRGFCEHYAMSFVVMMRTAGIPARIVAGYQGGEYNPVSNTVVVRQFDAHAWSEVWLQGLGWVRVDPTAAVAPSRIELGLEAALADEGSFLSDALFSATRYRDIGLINFFRQQYDAAAWRWQVMVVGYGGEVQLSVLRDLVGEITPLRLLALLGGVWLLVLVPTAWWLLRGRGGRSRSQAERAYWALCDELARRGMPRLPGEGLSALRERLAAALDEAPELVERIEAVEQALYDTAPSV
jgi:transglutaminase-like putative cysteine protease